MKDSWFLRPERPPQGGPRAGVAVKMAARSMVPKALWAAHGAPAPGRRPQPAVPIMHSGPLIKMRRTATGWGLPDFALPWQYENIPEGPRAVAASTTSRTFTGRLPMMIASTWCSGFVCGTLPAPRQQQFQTENAMK